MYTPDKRDMSHNSCPSIFSYKVLQGLQCSNWFYLSKVARLNRSKDAIGFIHILHFGEFYTPLWSNMPYPDLISFRSICIFLF